MVASERRSPNICIIGSGLSGICIAIKLLTNLKLKTFTIYEAQNDVAGNWLSNVYPGCAVDIPGHLYSFSFAPKSDWSSAYPSQAEVLEYIRDVTKQFQLGPHIQFGTKVQNIKWLENEKKWEVAMYSSITGERMEIFDIVINTTGKLRFPYYPTEYLGFEGTLIHSGEWDPTIDISNKRVGIIGTGASATQIIANIAPQVKHLTIFQRKAPYVFPRIQFDIPKFVQKAFEVVPGLLKLYRLNCFMQAEFFFYGFTRYNSLRGKIGKVIANWYRAFQLEDAELIRKCTPSYELAQKRVIISENFYPTLKRQNVRLVTQNIEKVEGEFVTTSNGDCINLDILILATGFKTQEYFAPMHISGRGGVDVLQKWKNGKPECYLGIMSWDMPNLFTINGPYAAIGHNSQIFNFECQSNWIVNALELLERKGNKCISIRKQAVDDFMTFLDRAEKHTVWNNDKCASWYLNDKGQNTMLWPLSQIEFWRWSKKFSENLFEFY